jgi:hypothetical protein
VFVPFHIIFAKFIVNPAVKYFSALLFLTLSISGLAQHQVGQWRSHLPMENFKWVGELSQKLVYANEYGLLVYDKEDQSLTALTKINHLTSTGITSFISSFEHDLCIIGYSDGNIDILESGVTIINQPAVATSNIIGDKAINDIEFDGDLALLFTGFGILQLDLNSYNILERGEVVIGGNNVIPTEGLVNSSNIYFTSSIGTFRTRKESFYTNPTFEELDINHPDGVITQFFELGDDLFVVSVNDSFMLDYIYKLEDTAFTRTTWVENREIRSITVEDDFIIASLFDAVEQHSFDLEYQTHIFTYGDGADGIKGQMAIKLRDGNITIADAQYGGVITTFENQYNSQLLAISSPSSAQISRISNIDDQIIALPGGNEFTFNSPLIHSYDELAWNSIDLNILLSVGVRNPVQLVQNDEFRYLALDGAGLLQLNHDNAPIQLFNEFNSSIEDRSDVDADYYGITDAGVDSRGNIWILNSLSSHPLKALHNDGTWTLIDFSDFPSPITKDLVVLESDLIVFSLKNEGLVIYDPAGTPRNTSDDDFRIINSSPAKGSLPSDNVLSFVEDRDGELWIGTDAGIGIIFNPESVFSTGFEGVQKIIVSQDGYNGYLFESDAVQSIAIDGANRKWIGAKGAGLFLISEDGQEQLGRYTQEDSPLLSNNIQNIAVQPSSGEVFLATEKGLQAYRSDATEPADFAEELEVFPNPVSSGYDGLISITGMGSESRVRITDASGNLMYETLSNGGSATWTGQDNQGIRVPSGVYLVFASAPDGSNGQVSKIMFNH